MRSRPMFMFLSIASMLAALYVAATNFAPIAVSGFGAPLQLPAGALMLIEYACGLLSIGAFWALQKRKEIKSDKNLETWAKQDAKLEVELTSDKVKLLEAKIATLEVALQSALKKQKA